MNRWESAKITAAQSILSKPRRLATLVRALVPEFVDYSVCVKLLWFYTSSELMGNNS